ncbi:MAG: hypothetical protein E6J91_26700 [Deltaproteobacteria bacterium]|nr:MAG: hypothetical protein E6J91_26700 [Deltaproteobacteria bacterium]
MWQRLARLRLRALWRQFPAVLILGARQVGKTTLARHTFPKLPYLDLEEPQLRELFTADPGFQLEARAKRGVILDEAQSVAALFPALRGAIDAQPCARMWSCSCVDRYRSGSRSSLRSKATWPRRAPGSERTLPRPTPSS